MNDLQVVETFILRNQNGYRQLAQDVCETCRHVQNSTSGLIYRVYSRAEKQAGDELKDAAKILEKLEPPVTEKKLIELHDIVGVTAVIYYPDDALAILNKITRALRKKSIKVTWKPRKYVTGYYAVHAAVRSSTAPHQGLLCEIQVKTVLHDAWSAKMHDLTYKPAGAIDTRLGGLMGAVSSQIEGIEQQSITIRNIINGRHTLETRAFQTLCDVMFSILKQGKPETLALTLPEASRLWTKIDKLRDAALAGNTNVSELRNVIDEIDSRCEKAPLIKIGWLLMTKLGSGLLFGDRTRDLVVQVDRFLEFARSNQTDHDINSAFLINIPNAFYVVGDLRRAAQYADQLLNGPLASLLDEQTKLGLYFNRLTYLLELEHIRPMRSLHLRTQLKQAVEAVLMDPVINQNDQMASALMDSRGLFKIVFGNSPSEVRQGIELCIKSVEIAHDWEKSVAEACADWRQEAGWLRYFDLINQAKP